MYNMNTIKTKSVCYPERMIPYNAWCKKFKVGSRVEKSASKKIYEPGEYDYDKFIKMIQNYGNNKKQSSIFREISETFFTLCKRQVQKTWNKISIA